MSFKKSAAPALGGDPESTAILLERVRSGDKDALEALFNRCLPPLRRWARGRLPAAARDLVDTEDLVQDALISCFKNLETFEHRHQGGLQAYLRGSVMHAICDQVRRVRRRGQQEDLDPDRADSRPSPLEQAIGRENAERYEAALQRLRPGDRDAIVNGLEMGLSHLELAEALGKPSADAARMALSRAIARLIKEMSRAA